ncbi:aminotransferase class I/II-fold pyridoxal phosphate-dependent enzyme [Vallicoccus soli]|uniref:cysteine-S-conjugate beta-lyase n=2 Tax=Vallicoccus soli TaxID=2339232 RepID=A0A3A3YXI7_9ACTN|nr:aminotransferase class I/II-fold pyridoxal phosphate-dependent enzyme [Vallicoccus soli]
MDVDLAPPVAAALRAAVERSDTGYAGDVAPLVAAFRGFAARRWEWEVGAGDVTTCADVGVGTTELLRAALAPGDGVVLMPPLYPPVRGWLATVGAVPVDVPLLEGRMDLGGVDRALADGARAVFLCHPHNPTGRVHGTDELQALAELALRHGALVVADEIHGPLAPRFTPYLTVSGTARATGVALTSASKAWNLAGLKCALLVAQGEGPRELVGRLPHETVWGVGLLGALAAEAAFRDGEPWLDGLLAGLAANLDLLGPLLAEHLPEVGYARPEAGYLAWLDCRRLGLGDDPAAAFLAAGVALVPGPDFGPGGAGFARLNAACHPDLLREAVRRMAAARAA